jgi:hypothetical protein
MFFCNFKLEESAFFRHNHLTHTKRKAMAGGKDGEWDSPVRQPWRTHVPSLHPSLPRSSLSRSALLSTPPLTAKPVFWHRMLHQHGKTGDRLQSTDWLEIRVGEGDDLQFRLALDLRAINGPQLRQFSPSCHDTAEKSKPEIEEMIRMRMRRQEFMKSTGHSAQRGWEYQRSEQEQTDKLRAATRALAPASYDGLVEGGGGNDMKTRGMMSEFFCEPQPVC